MLILKMNNEKVSICEIDLPAIFFLPQSQQTNLITFRPVTHGLNICFYEAEGFKDISPRFKSFFIILTPRCHSAMSMAPWSKTLQCQHTAESSFLVS